MECPPNWNADFSGIFTCPLKLLRGSSILSICMWFWYSSELEQTQIQHCILYSVVSKPHANTQYWTTSCWYHPPTVQEMKWNGKHQSSTGSYTQTAQTAAGIYSFFLFFSCYSPIFLLHPPIFLLALIQKNSHYTLIIHEILILF